MSMFQDNVNKIIEEKERTDLVDSIVGQRGKEFDEFLESQKNNIQNYTTEELEYMNSEYYPIYDNCLNQLENYA